MLLHAVKKPAGEARAGADEDEDGGRIARTKGGFPRVPPFGSNAASCTTGNRTRVSSPWF